MVCPTPGSTPKIRFHRFECKYVVTEAQAILLHRYLEPYLEADPYAAQRRDRRYPISSLYLDNSALRLYQETRSGQRSRFKLRIRAYSDDPSEPVFFEIKRRDRTVIAKRRSRVSRDRLSGVLAGCALDSLFLSTPEREALLDFTARADRVGARPVVMVRYDREAYQGIVDDNVRVTYDRGLRARATDQPIVCIGGSDWDLIDGRSVIVEFKFSGQCPAWLTEAARRLSIQRRSFSKYAHSVEKTLGGIRRQVGS